MAGEQRTTATIEELMALGAIVAHKDGNYGSNYPRVEEFGSEGVPFLTAKSLREGYVDIAGAPRLGDARADELTFGFVETDGVLLSHNATIGRVAVVPPHKGRLLVGTSLTYFRLNPQKLLPRYLAVYLAGAEFQNQLVAVMSHSTRNQVPVTAQRKLSVVVPPLAEQKAIAAVLGALDDKIELNRRINATLEVMARALFQSWFVDFDPVRAKLDGRQPTGLDPATAALFPATFQDSELGHIPHAWQATILGACIGFRSGFSFKSQDWQEAGVPVVKIGSVKPGIIDLTQVSYVSEEIAQQAARYRLTTGDMLIGMTGYVGEVGLVPPSDNPPLLNQRVGKFAMQKPGTESLAFWYCTTRQPEFRAFVEARSHGTA